MSAPAFHDHYPPRIVFFSALQVIAIYTLGILILLPLGGIWAAFYAAFCLWGEFRVMRGGCVNCHYYGRACAFGRGWLGARFFRRGDPGKFNTRPITWASLIPDMLVSLLPLGAGVYLLLRGFSWLLLGLMLLLILLAFPVTGFIRGHWACAHCRQRELGCPAERLFDGRT